MPERVNAAHRLDHFVRQAVTFPDGTSTVEVWTQVFGITDSDAPTTAVEVVRMVGLLRKQVIEVRGKMQNTSVRPVRYEDGLNNILLGLDVQNLSAQWTDYNRYLRPDIISVLGWCADSLPAEEEVIDTEDLDRFKEEVRTFGDRIAASSVPDYVKSFALEQVAIIEQAIRDYPVVGARAFKRGYVEAFFNFSENQNTYLEREDEEEMQELRGFWGQLQNYAQKAGPWIAIAQAAEKMAQLMGGS